MHKRAPICYRLERDIYGGLMRNTILGALAAFAVAHSAVAQLDFLRGGPMERMNKEDMRLLTDNYRQALEQLADGHTSTWTNPKTGHSGTATPQKTFQRKGQKCRVLEMTNAADGLTGASEYTFCKQAVGAWKIVS